VKRNSPGQRKRESLFFTKQHNITVYINDNSYNVSEEREHPSILATHCKNKLLIKRGHAVQRCMVVQQAKCTEQQYIDS